MEKLLTICLFNQLVMRNRISMILSSGHFETCSHCGLQFMPFKKLDDCPKCGHSLNPFNDLEIDDLTESYELDLV